MLYLRGSKTISIVFLWFYNLGIDDSQPLSAPHTRSTWGLKLSLFSLGLLGKNCLICQKLHKAATLYGIWFSNVLPWPTTWLLVVVHFLCLSHLPFIVVHLHWFPTTELLNLVDEISQSLNCLLKLNCLHLFDLSWYFLSIMFVYTSFGLRVIRTISLPHKGRR